MTDEPKPPMPDALRPLAEAAIVQHEKRPAPPQTVTHPKRRGEWLYLTCPYREEDEGLWLALMLECFGTRTADAGQAFMRQLAALCPEVLYNGEEEARIDEEALRQALAIVYSLKPRTEAEGAFAAQLVALHLTAMKVGAQLGKYSSVDIRSAATLAALVKAYGNGLATLQGLKGGGRRSTRQTVIVKRETHVHHHHHDEKHVHLPDGGRGGGNLHAQSQGPDELRARATRSTGGSAKRAALPSPNAEGDGLPVSINEGPEAVPVAWRGEGDGSAEG